MTARSSEHHTVPIPSVLEEPQLQPPASPREKRVHAVIERVASILMSLVAAIMLVLVCVMLVDIVADAWGPLMRHDYMAAALAGLDSAFLAIILLELVHTTVLRGALSVQLQEFLVIGVMSAIRSALEVVAGSRSRAPRDVAIDLVITCAAVLVLVAAIWLLRQRLHHERVAEQRRIAREVAARH
jgi:phosphate starvation-inducible membrane PsiE